MKTLIAILAIGGAAAAGITAYAGGPAAGGGNASRESVVLKDGKGALLDAGTKRAVAYYLKDGNTCQVSVIVSETFAEQIPFNLATVRFSSSVPAGTSSEVATSDGNVMSLTCASGAKSLAVESRDLVAWAPVN